ncbi:glycoside hydrolase family 95 protein [Paenibacillus lautus]|uniref:glycoside hydrolase family 95 protein n=1 Tax=Paenibacillus lautus TaxID=1401 RepID=UPI00203C6EEF|nr:glycoside hydrolase N-terminal domain-containing protein [Paenibacillus lautus]MCM3257805.1 glycoside hydrolase family 95 protein [Paenibacillus lautus]
MGMKAVDGLGTYEGMLWYRNPAAEWVDALAVGNGRLGGMVYGGIFREHISLNEDTLWSGHPYDPNNREAAAYLETVQKLVFEGKYPEAQRTIEEHMLGPWSESYQPLGDLYLELEETGKAEHYRRELDLNDAVCRTRFTLNGVRYVRETFVSAVDQVMVVRFTADQPGRIAVRASLDSQLRHQALRVSADKLAMKGRSPSHVEPLHARSNDPVIYEEGRGIRFEAQLLALPEGGATTEDGEGRIRIEGADAVTFLLAASTSFNGFDKNPVLEGRNPAELCRSCLDAAAKLSYGELLDRHVQDYRALYGRVELELDAPGLQHLPTDERIRALREDKTDEQLAVLFFQFGRYLLLSSSRPGTQAANLQGIWNQSMRPPWSCNYTVNINTQMNYWPAEVCNLAECHEPLFRLLEDLRIAGRETASAHYKARGWVSHHAVDLWRITTPSGGPSGGPASWAYWPMGGAWLSQHVWEHYRFGGDRTFLSQVGYPIMKEAALFFLDYLIEDADGYLVSNPSTSPENTFALPDGRKAAVSMDATMDIALLRELFGNCMEASDHLGIDRELRLELAAARARLRPFQIGRRGQLQEWFSDFEEAEPGHRHMAHLYPLHPGGELDHRRTPELANACRVSIDLRLQHEGEDAVGWCFAWLISLFARLDDGEMAHRYLTKLLKNPFDNLFNAHRHPKLTFYPLTIEANLGATAGIAEMLLQSHAGELNLLPALPEAWKGGRVSGLRARGGFTVSLAWTDCVLSEAVIASANGEHCRIRTDGNVQVTAGTEAVEVREIAPCVVEFRTEPGVTYTITRC